MRCMKCGAKVDGGVTICPHCGKALSERTEIDEEVSPSAAEEIVEAKASDFGYVNNIKPYDPVSSLSPNMQMLSTLPYYEQWTVMFGWGLLVTVFNKAMEFLDFVSGSYYTDEGVTAEGVYAYYGVTAKYIDYFHLVLLAVTVACAVWGYIALKRHRNYAPYLVLATYGVCFINSLVTAAMRTHIFGFNFFTFWPIGSIVGSLGLLIFEGIIFYKYRNFYTE